LKPKAGDLKPKAGDLKPKAGDLKPDNILIKDTTSTTFGFVA
jgi:hypothetical protein